MNKKLKQPEIFGKILDELFKKLGLADGLKQQQAVLAWKDIVGETISRISEPEKIEHGRLFIRVEDSAWRQELHYHKHKIMKKLNDKLGKKAVKEIILV
ncbi:DUF721 domain-containing protein [candidate division KSB1 bacterium]